MLIIVYCLIGPAFSKGRTRHGLNNRHSPSVNFFSCSRIKPHPHHFVWNETNLVFLNADKIISKAENPQVLMLKEVYPKIISQKLFSECLGNINALIQYFSIAFYMGRLLVDNEGFWRRNFFCKSTFATCCFMLMKAFWSWIWLLWMLAANWLGWMNFSRHSRTIFFEGMG